MNAESDLHEIVISMLISGSTSELFEEPLKWVTPELCIAEGGPTKLTHQ